MSHLKEEKIIYPEHMRPHLQSFLTEVQLMLCKSGVLHFVLRLLDDMTNILIRKTVPKLPGFFCFSAKCFDLEVEAQDSGHFSLIYAYYCGPRFPCTVATGDFVLQRITLGIQKNAEATGEDSLRPEDEVLLRTKVLPLLRKSFLSQRWEVYG